MDDKIKKHLEDILWSIVINHLPLLRNEIEKLLKTK
jgi:uncharacterized protein with HEPN domain